MRTTHISLAALAILAAGHLRAQSSDDVAAYQALIRTPVGALAPIATKTMIGTLQEGASFAIRYGYMPRVSANAPSGNNFAATAILPAGMGSSLSLTGGIASEYCAGCGSKLMLSGGGDMRIGSMPFGSTATSPRVTFTVNGELGYSQRSPGSFISGHVGLPIALVPTTRPGSGLRFVPFVTPGFGFANITGAGGANGSGTRYTIGGGVGLYNTDTNVMVDFGFQHVEIQGGKTLIGLAIVMGR